MAIKLMHELKQCPKCKRAGEIDTMFGWRVSKEKRIPQSQCKKCRSQRKGHAGVTTGMTTTINISQAQFEALQVELAKPPKVIPAIATLFDTPSILEELRQPKL